MMAGERGEYRAIPVVLLDGPDFQRLTAAERWTFVALKMNLGPSGIEVRYPEALAHELAAQTGHDVPTVKAAINTLCREHWIQVQGNVVWVKEQLQHEPNMRPSDPKHRKAIQRHAAGLPHLPIVDCFRERYAEWFTDTPPEDPSKGDGRVMEDPTQGSSKGLRSINPSPSPSLNQEQNQLLLPGDGEEAPPARLDPTAAAVGEFCEKTTAAWPNKLSIAEWSRQLGAEPAFAGLDIPLEIRSCADWHLSAKKVPKSPGLAIRNWLKNAKRNRTTAAMPSPDSLLADCKALLHEAGPQIKIAAARPMVFEHLAEELPIPWRRSGGVFQRLEYVQLVNAGTDYERTQTLKAQLERLALRTA